MDQKQPFHPFPHWERLVFGLLLTLLRGFCLAAEGRGRGSIAVTFHETRVDRQTLSGFHVVKENNGLVRWQNYSDKDRAVLPGKQVYEIKNVSMPRPPSKEQSITRK